MRTRLSGFICAALLAVGLSAVASADNEVKTAMRGMGKALSSSEKASDAPALKQELQALRTSTLQAQANVPDALRSQPADSADRKLYAEGIAKLLTEIDNGIALAGAGKYDEAHATLEKIKQIRGEYHKKLRP